ncbi:MAG: extracellular solute-binding protein, partial [Thermomicrobiales bacterium]
MQKNAVQDPTSDATNALPRHLSQRVVLGAMALGVAGIGGAVGVVREQGASRSSGRIPITVWSWQSSAEVQALSNAAEGFNASQEEIEVQVVQRPGTFPSIQLQLTIREGLGPDVCIGGRGLLAERDAVDFYDDIAPYLDDVGISIDLDHACHSSVAREVRIGKRLIGIPLEATVQVLMVNRSIFAEEGVDATEWSPDHGPVTFDRLADVAQSLNRRDASGAYERVGFVPTFDQGSAYQYLKSWGARYFDEGKCTFTVDTPEALGAAQWVNDYVQHERAQQLDDLLRRGLGVAAAAGTPFLRGDIVFAIATDQELNAIAAVQPDIDLGATFVPVPDGSMPSRSWVTGNALSLMTGSGHPREAVRFLAYMATEDVLSRYCLSIGSMSSRVTMPTELLKGLARPSFVTDIVLPAAIPSPHVPIATQFGDLMGTYWSYMLSGHTDVKAGLTDLQSQANKDLAYT